MINTNTLNMTYNLCLKFKLITLWILTFTFIVIWVNKAYVLGNNEGNSANIFLLKNWCPYQVYPIFQHNEGHNFICLVLITSLFQIWEDQISKRLGFIMKLLFSLENVETSMQWGYFWWTWVKTKWRKWPRKLWQLWE